MRRIASICLLGFGEVGQKLAKDLNQVAGLKLSGFDILFSDSASAPSLALESLHFVRPGASAQDAAVDADLVISAVTAANALEAVRSVSAILAPETYFVDLNSVSPDTRLEAAAIIENTGAHYVEAAVMSAIHPGGITVPMLLGGPHAEDVSTRLQRLGFSRTVSYAAEIGRASAVKMCRSVLVKGFEALLMESLLAARHYGVEADVLASLADQFPANNWTKKPRYMISRSLEHGRRRAEEMREVMRTVEQAGIKPLMSDACARRQEWTAKCAAALREPDLSKMLDAILRLGTPDHQLPAQEDATHVDH